LQKHGAPDAERGADGRPRCGRQLGVTHAATEGLGVTMVPLDAVDLSHVSILYTQGEMAAITPIYDYDFHARARRNLS